MPDRDDYDVTQTPEFQEKLDRKLARDARRRERAERWDDEELADAVADTKRHYTEGQETWRMLDYLARRLRQRERGREVDEEVRWTIESLKNLRDHIKAGKDVEPDIPWHLDVEIRRLSAALHATPEDSGSGEGEAPTCPECGRPMRNVWGCDDGHPTVWRPTSEEASGE